MFAPPPPSTRPPPEDTAQHRIDTAVGCLHISAVVYLLVAALLLLLSFLFEDRPGPDAVMGRILVAGFCFALIAVIEVVAFGLRRRKFWAWTFGLCIFAIYLPSLFLPLGVAGLRGLLDRRVKREFGVG